MDRQITINPDKVKIVIHPDNLHVGGSCFVPCLNVNRAMRQLDRAADKQGVKFTYRRLVENGYSGVRFWRIS